MKLSENELRRRAEKYWYEYQEALKIAKADEFGCGWYDAEKAGQRYINVYVGLMKRIKENKEAKKQQNNNY